MTDLTTSPDVAELAKALAAAQGEIKAAAKDRENPFFNSRYATLDAIWDACRGPLASHGLCIVQGASADEQTITVTTLLLHTSGQWIKSPLTLVPKDASPQAAGSAITYARRYGLGAMVGVTAEEDDDGNAAQPPARRAPRGAPKMQAPQGGGMPPQSAEETEAEAKRLFPTPEEEERNTLVAEAIALAKKLKLTPQDRAAFKQEYLGGAEPDQADVAALATMVAELRKRAA